MWSFLVGMLSTGKQSVVVWRVSLSLSWSTATSGLLGPSRFRSSPSGSLISPPNKLEFFNREEEIKLLRDTLSGAPTLSLVTGPINSGKSWLMQRVIDDFKLGYKEERPAILPLNLRRMPFHDFNSFLNCFNAELQTLQLCSNNSPYSSWNWVKILCQGKERPQVDDIVFY